MADQRAQTARIRRRTRRFQVVTLVSFGALLALLGWTVYVAVHGGLHRALMSSAYSWLAEAVLMTLVAFMQQVALRAASQQVQVYDNSYKLANQMLDEALVSIDEMITTHRVACQATDSEDAAGGHI